MAMENDGIPEHLMSKLAKCGMPDDGGDHDQMMAAYMTYMSTTDDGPAERQEMRKAMERMKADMDEPEAKMDMDDSDETSEDKSKKMSAKLRRDASLDPAVAKLVESLTSRVSKMDAELSSYKGKEAARAEQEFYAAASRHTTREEAKEFLALCGGSHEAALKIIGKLPVKSGAMGRWLSGGDPGGASAKDSPVEDTKVVAGGRIAIHGRALSAAARKAAEGIKAPAGTVKQKEAWRLAEAQRRAVRENPALYQTTYLNG